MAFISVFDVLGPNMIGPSSSHTAGAEIIAFLAQKMIAPPLKRADFTLYGSFAKTYHGHPHPGFLCHCHRPRPWLQLHPQ